jgi:hypothetical protein
MNKKIIFRYSSKHQDNNYPGLVSGKKTIPNWYKQIPSYLKPREGIKPFGRDISTVKKCIPFFEGMTSGYMLTMPFDMFVQSTKEFVRGDWQVETDGSVELEDPERIPGLVIGEEYSKSIIRVNLFPSIKTPKGNSLLITHPINRTDLPFYTLGAVIDSDFDGMSIALNVLIKKDFNGIIEKGTPMAQVIPFQRDNWTSERGKIKSEEQIDKESFNITSTIKNSYVKNFWHKKNFN